MKMKEENSTVLKDKPSIWTWARDSILLVGTIVVIFAALSNSLTWHLQLLWGASGDFWQSLWDKIIFRLGDDEFTHTVIYMNIWVGAVYWILGLAFVPLDVFNWPKWTRKYKVQPGTNEPVDTQRLLSAAGQVLFNQFAVSLPLSVVGYFLKRGSDVATLPTFSRVLIELVVFILVEEVGFYYSHRLFHHPRIYKHFHKKHHQWTAPVAITAIYCHPLEHLISNMLPLLMGPIIMSSHVAVMALWFTAATINTVIVHSGYHFPGFVSPESHDFHHQKFTECYGVLGILDYLHGTNRLFRSSPSYKRHFITLSLEPIRSQFVDEPKKEIIVSKNAHL